jgi:L-prolyl-PCP dehydrogenase
MAGTVQAGAARAAGAVTAPLPLVLTHGQRNRWASVAGFAREHLAGGAADRDASAAFCWDGWRRCAESGLLGLPLPAGHGGGGESHLTTVVAFDALGYGCHDGGLLFSMAAHLWACSMTVARFGTAGQRQEYLPRMCDGSLIAAHAMTEPGSGSDAFAMATTAQPAGGGYLLNGEKAFVTNAGVAGVFITFAASKQRPGPYGLTCFLVDATAPGVATGPPVAKLGLRTSPMASVFFSDCLVPRSSVLGKPGMGMAIFNEAMHLERAFIMAGALGTMQRQVERGASALRSRRHPAGAAGAADEVAHRLARMASRLHTSRLLAYGHAAKMGTGRVAAHESALVKLKLSEAFVRNSEDARANDLALGHWPAAESERELRDALASRIYSGTNEIQRTLLAHGLGL